MPIIGTENDLSPGNTHQTDEATLRALKTRAKNGVAWLAIQNAGTKAMGLVFFVVLARLLNPEAFGLLASAAVFTGIANLLMEQGLGQAIIQRHELKPEHLDTVFWAQLGFALLIAVVGVLFAPLLAQLFHQPSLTNVIRVMFLNTPLSALCSVQDSLLERKLAFDVLARRRLGATLASGFAAIGMALAGLDVWSLVGQQLVASAVAVVLLWNTSGWRPGRLVRWTALRDLLGFSMHLFFQRGLSVVKSRADDLLMGLYLGPVALGLYSTATRVVEAASSLFIDTFAKFSLSLFSRLQEDDGALRGVYGASVFGAALFGMPASAGLILSARDIVQVFLGPAWLGVTPLLQVLALLIFSRSVGTANIAVILAKGQSFYRLMIVGAYALFSLLLVFLLISRGALVVSWINVICTLGLLPVNIWLVWKLIHFEFKAYGSLIVPPLISAVIMFLALLPVRSALEQTLSPALRLGLVSVVGALVYGLALALVSRRFRQLFASMWQWAGDRGSRLRRA